MAQINKPSEYFRIKTYTGNATNDTAITWDESSNMQPDFLWFKNRSQTQSHALFDVIRGADKRLISNSTGAEGTEATNLDSFDTNGFTVDYEAIVNGSGDNMVTWGWSAGGTAVSNTDGNVNTTVSANPTNGFSIISANTGSTTGELTLGHGLNAVPSMFIWKNRDDAGQNWQVYHKSTGTGLMRLNDTGAVNNDVVFWNTHTTSLFKMTTHMYSQNKNFIGYCFAEKKGFSKFGSYVSNANIDGTFVYLGFKPAFVIIKKTNGAGSWFMLDNKRNTYNPVNTRLTAEGNYVDDTNSAYATDFVSNGFKLRTNSNPNDGSGNTFIYMAFAENPLVGTNNIPATAR
jgi:hypothetical protein